MPRHKNTLRIKCKPNGSLWVWGSIEGERIRFSTGFSKGEEDKAKLTLAKFIAKHEEENSTTKQATFTTVALNYISMSTNKTKDKEAQFISDLRPYIGDMLMSQIGARPYPKVKETNPHILNKFIWDQAHGLIINDEGKTVRREECKRDGYFLKALNKKGMTVSNVNKKISFLNTLAKAGVKKHLLIDSSGWDEIREVDEHEQVYFKLNPEGIKIGYENEWLAHLMGLLPKYLSDMALFSVHTAQRDAVVCNLRWDWLKEEDDYYFFQIPIKFMKSEKKMKRDKQNFEYVILNDRARDLVLSLRGNGSDRVFIHDDGSYVKSQNVTAFQTARDKTAQVFPEMLDEDGMHLCDIHSYKRTFVNICDVVGIEDAVAHKLSNHAKQGVHDIYRNSTPPKRKFLHMCLQQINDAYDIEPKVRLHYDSDLGMKKSYGNASG